MNFQTQQERLNKKMEKLQIKCVKEAWDEKKDDWNKEHFKYCEADVLKFQEKQLLTDKKMVQDAIEEWAKDSFVFNEVEQDYEIDGLSVHIKDLKQQLTIGDDNGK